MKHFILLLLAGWFGYLGWTTLPPQSKTLAAAFVRRHATPLFIIFLVLLAGWVLAFYFSSTSLL
jgi:hypothetical protein